MKFLLIALILLFYIFFFIRAYTLSKSLGKNIKAKNTMLNISIIFSGISSFILLAFLLFPQIEGSLIIFYSSSAFTIIGSILISIGLITSSIASLSLKKSWRIGIDESQKTELITSGIYKLSRNPYFLSYDLVLVVTIFCLLSPFLIVPVIITITLFHLMILKEEKYLEKHHTDNYRKYKKEVRRYI